MARPTSTKAFWAVSLVAGVGLFLASCSEDAPTSAATPPAAAFVTAPSRIAITIDDLPYVMPSKTSPAQGLRYTRRITAALRRHEIVATGFAVGQLLTPKSLPALQAFAEAGHSIGNHSWSHPDYDTLSRAAFLDETRRTDAALAKWIDGPRYYRFPFLREGKTAASKAAATEVLTELGYQNVPVTIDNDEWQFNADYLAALDRGDRAAAAEIGRAYVAHMQERTVYFQTLAQEKLNGDVDHILLIHLNRINADHLGTLLDWYAAQGGTFITVEDAMAHPLFARPDIYVGPRGLSQIERVLGGKQVHSAQP